MKQLTLKNGDTVSIRPAVRTDAKAIIDYVNAVYGESDFLTYGPGEFPMTVEMEEGFLENLSKQNNSLYLVAEIAGKIVAALSFLGGSKPRMAHAGDMGLTVLKAYWGNGIGTALIEYLIEWCRQGGVIRKINLYVRTDNAAAIHVYKKLGFVEHGIITREFRVNGVFYDSLAMGYEID